jgi:hypothetical protein
MEEFHYARQRSSNRLLALSSSKGTGPAKAFDFASRKNQGESQTMFGLVTTNVAAFNE